MGAGTGDEGEFQEKEKDDDEQFDFGSRVSLNSSTQEKEAYTNKGTGTMDQFDLTKLIRPVRRLCEYDEFGNANWGERVETQG